MPTKHIPSHLAFLFTYKFYCFFQVTLCKASFKDACTDNSKGKKFLMHFKKYNLIIYPGKNHQCLVTNTNLLWFLQSPYMASPKDFSAKHQDIYQAQP